MRHLLAVFLVLPLVGIVTGCSLSADPSGYSRVTIQVPAPGQHLPTPFESMLSGSPPATSDGFQCLAVNVIGPGIAQSFGNPNDSKHFQELLNRTSYCTYPGITALIAHNPTGPASINVNLKVPSGPKRLVQMLGFVDPANEICSNGALDARSDNTNSAKPFEIARTLTDLFHDTHVDLVEDWNGLTATEQATRNLDCKSPLELYANAVRSESSLVAYWPFVETGGTVATNAKVGMGDMTLGGGSSLGVAVGPVVDSTALRIPAVSGTGVAAGHTFSTATFMIEVWAKISTCTSSSAIFQMKSASNEKIEIYCDLSGFLNVFVSDSVGASNSVNVGNLVADGQWHYIAAGKDASDYLKLYFDGTHAGDSSSNSWMSNAFPFTGSPHTWVGFDEVNAGIQPGDYAHLAIYDQALTPAQVTAHYNAAGFTAKPSLIGPKR